MANTPGGERRQAELGCLSGRIKKGPLPLPPPYYPPQIAAEAARGGVLAPPELRALRSLEAALSGHGVAPGGDGKRLVPAFGG